MTASNSRGTRAAGERRERQGLQTSPGREAKTGGPASQRARRRLFWATKVLISLRVLHPCRRKPLASFHTRCHLIREDISIHSDRLSLISWLFARKNNGSCGCQQRRLKFLVVAGQRLQPLTTGDRHWSDLELLQNCRAELCWTFVGARLPAHRLDPA